jgi:hypothetical protein
MHRMHLFLFADLDEFYISIDPSICAAEAQRNPSHCSIHASGQAIKNSQQLSSHFIINNGFDARSWTYTLNLLALPYVAAICHKLFLYAKILLWNFRISACLQ